MDVNQQASLNKLQQAQKFLDTHAAMIEMVNRSPARSELDEAVRSIHAHSDVQNRATVVSRGLTKVKNDLHRDVRHELGRMAALARARREKFGSIQDIKSHSQHTSDDKLYQYARGMGGKLEEFRSQFESEGLSADFVDRFRELVEDFVQAVSEQRNSLRDRSGASKGIKENLRRGWVAISVIRALFEDGDSGQRRLRAEWLDVTIHAARALPKASQPAKLAAPAAVPQLTAGAATPPVEGTAVTPLLVASAVAPVLALSSGETSAGMAIAAVPEHQTLSAAPPRRGWLRSIARLFGSERVA